MSRFSVTKNNVELCYGFDHANGYFYQKWVTPVSDEDDGLLVDRDSYCGMPNSELLEVLMEFGAPQEHIDATALDLPF